MVKIAVFIVGATAVLIGCGGGSSSSGVGGSDVTVGRSEGVFTGRASATASGPGGTSPGTVAGVVVVKEDGNVRYGGLGGVPNEQTGTYLDSNGRFSYDASYRLTYVGIGVCGVRETVNGKVDDVNATATMNATLRCSSGTVHVKSIFNGKRSSGSGYPDTYYEYDNVVTAARSLSMEVRHRLTEFSVYSSECVVTSLGLFRGLLIQAASGNDCGRGCFPLNRMW